MDKKNKERKDVVDDLMEKYGIEERKTLEDIIGFSGMALNYSHDYEDGLRFLLEEMYDYPQVFAECIDRAKSKYMEGASDDRKEMFYRAYENVLEIGRRPCDNLDPIYGGKCISYIEEMKRRVVKRLFDEDDFELAMSVTKVTKVNEILFSVDGDENARLKTTYRICSVGCVDYGIVFFPARIVSVTPGQDYPRGINYMNGRGETKDWEGDLVIFCFDHINPISIVV